MNPRFVCLVLLLTACGLGAQTKVWQPGPGLTQVPIWGGVMPDPQPDTGPERMEVMRGDHLVAGEPWTAVYSVSRPTMTVYPARGRNTGAAMVVFPGGGYEDLAIDLEGTDICEWLTSIGVTGVLVKYRVPGPGLYPKPAPHRKSGPYPKSPVALQDAQRALSLVRSRALELGINPFKIGVIGFSAGGHLVAATSTHFAQRVYTATDAVDQVSCRPDFAVAIYPGHLSLAEDSLALNPDIASHITRETPPTFLLQNQDDDVDRVEHSLSYYAALKKAGVKVEMHLYSAGGHAFGLRRTPQPATDWPKLVERWLRTIGVISAEP